MNKPAVIALVITLLDAMGTGLLPAICMLIRKPAPVAATC